LPPNDNQLIERFLKDDDFLTVSPNTFNSLGLGLTQLYNTTWVYNHKRKGEFKLNGKTVEFILKSAYPIKATKEFLLVELLNRMDDLAEIPTLARISNNLHEFDITSLMKMAQNYGSSRSKKILKSLVRKEMRDA
jgi:hypothetical protein